jgi:hypothetical protein
MKRYDMARPIRRRSMASYVLEGLASTVVLIVLFVATYLLIWLVAP